jgi:hypothetical protein
MIITESSGYIGSFIYVSSAVNPLTYNHSFKGETIMKQQITHVRDMREVEKYTIPVLKPPDNKDLFVIMCAIQNHFTVTKFI